MSLRAEIYPDDGIGIEAEKTAIIKEIMQECTRAYKDPLCAGVYLTDDEGIREKNLMFRKIDSATDVLSFPLLEANNGKLSYSDADWDMENDCVILGDIIISMDRISSQARDYGHSEERELAFLVCHGMLHLLGYDHEGTKDEKKMLYLQKEILDRLGYTR